MANVYVRSAAAGAGTGADWANAFTTLAAAAAAKAAGDVFWVAEDHAETQASAIAITFPGTLTSPNRCFCVDHAGTVPPVAADLRTTATVTTTGNFGITILGSVYGYGIKFSAGSGAVGIGISLSSTTHARQKWDTCDLIQAGTTGGNNVFGASGANSDIELANCRLQFAGAAARILFRQRVRISGGSVIAGGTTPVSLINPVSGGLTHDVEWKNFDFSNFAAAMNMIAGGAVTSGGRIGFYGCNPPSTGHTVPWSGNLVSAAITNAGFRTDMSATDSADTDAMYQERVEDYTGSVREETASFVRSGGATIPNSKSGGVSPIPFAWKFAPSALCAYPLSPLRSSPIEVFSLVNGDAAAGASMTLTAHLLFDQVADINDNDFWMEVSYPGTAGKTLYAASNSQPATLLTTAIALGTKFAAGSGWTTTSMTNPKQRTVACTFTPAEIGVILVTLCCGNAAPAAVYADPLIVRS